MLIPLSRLFTYLFIVLASLIAIPHASALDMSSKRDCVICHIMWLNDFRTDKETLIEFQPGNVLMKDTQGVVSTEDMCYSCHDGYVQDSRNFTWSYNRHPVFVKPSKNVTIPPELPLSVNGEIYCGTCHSAHGKGASAHSNPTGRTKIYRDTNVDSSLCEKCHVNEKSYKTANGHPLHSDKLELPDRLFDLGAKKATLKNKVICQSCHGIHGSKGDKILLIDNRSSELCIICHEEKQALIDTKHDLRLTLPDEKNIKKQTLPESGPCGACHTPHNAEGNNLWARPLVEGNPASQLCLSCHGAETHYKIKNTGKYSHPVNVSLSKKDPYTGDLPLFAENGARIPEGNLQCFTCHDIHKWDPESFYNKGDKNTEGDSSNSFLRISNRHSLLCLECHDDKQQLIESDHNLELTAPDEKNIQDANTVRSGPCGACHTPHNAVSERLWARELSGDNNFANELCVSCHNKEGLAKAKLIGDNFHPFNVPLEKFNITTTLPLYDDSGHKKLDAKIACLTCHDPHVWDPDGPVLNYTSENIEGDAGNSFLRKSASPTSDLCRTCHEDKAFIDGTDHDLNITGPEAKNLLGQTARESGQCGVCHLVHNSPNRIKLWARHYGNVPGGEDIVNGLCRSCHSKGNPAENKIPVIASHPEDKLINNVMRNNRDALDFAPIFDRTTGKEVSVGNISCPTCHNTHQWSPLDKKAGINKNLEGNATNSFLRNVSYNNICIDCHGLDALFRFKYYHDPEERVEPVPKRVKSLE
jgi:predicted CXXCH cytochrome family protein